MKYERFTKEFWNTYANQSISFGENKWKYWKKLQELQKNLKYANQSISFGTKYKQMIQISVFIEFEEKIIKISPYNLLIKDESFDAAFNS